MESAPALKPVYTTSELNQPIELYQGKLTVSLEGRQGQNESCSGDGKIEYVWFPSPRIKFGFQGTNQNHLGIRILASPNHLTLSLPEEASKSVIVLTNSSITTENKLNLSGSIQDPLVHGHEQDLAYLLFHVPNFQLSVRGNPIQLDSEEWKITLDKVYNYKYNVGKLNSQGGFAITHVGKLERVDGNTFSLDQAVGYLDIFGCLLSFVRGLFIVPILFVGYDTKGNKVLEYWDCSRSAQFWRTVNSWFRDDCRKIKLDELLPGFVQWFQNSESSGRMVLYWYLEANITGGIGAGSLESSIIFAQAALELACWEILVIKEKEVSEKEFKKLRASCKIRRLLDKLNISKRIPPNRTKPKSSQMDSLSARKLIEKLSSKKLIENLVKLAQNKNYEDGPRAFTEMRNGIVHPRQKMDIEGYSKALHDASDFGLWYLELILLYLFDYQGFYKNRLGHPSWGAEPVPWSGESVFVDSD